MPWMTIYPLASSFSYDKDGDKYKGTQWIIHNLIDAVAKGGCFMVGIGPDKTGCFHPKAVEQLEETGKWLQVNGEGIYNTRACEVWKEGNTLFTRSKDNKTVFAIVEQFPENELSIEAVTPEKGSDIYLSGYPKPLKWKRKDGKTVIIIPEELRNEANRPCKYAYTFKLRTKS
jgi:alpha-L-fucosidase